MRTDLPVTVVVAAGGGTTSLSGTVDYSGEWPAHGLVLRDDKLALERFIPWSSITWVSYDVEDKP